MKFGHVDQLNDVTFNFPSINNKTKGLLYPPKTPQKNSSMHTQNNLIVLRLMLHAMVLQKLMY